MGDAIIDALDALTARLRIAAWDEPGDAFMGPLVSAPAAAGAHAAVERLVATGARVIRPFAQVAGRSDAFVTPSILDVTGVSVPDAEVFAPVLQVTRVPDFQAAIAAANATAFGLSAGLVSSDPGQWQAFLDASRAGIVNRNRPTTGAAANMPFGGLGASGNHRPSAYYAADYCAYPIGSFEADSVQPIPVPGA
jgi:succinylglutamic semialdehyde dehydrogenase